MVDSRNRYCKSSKLYEFFKSYLLIPCDAASYEVTSYFHKIFKACKEQHKKLRRKIAWKRNRFVFIVLLAYNTIHNKDKNAICL